MYAATDSRSVAVSMVTSDEACVSNSSVLPNKGTLSGASCDISPRDRGVGVQDGGEAIRSFPRGGGQFGSVRRIPRQPSRARSAAGNQRVLPDGRTAPPAGPHVSCSGG